MLSSVCVSHVVGALESWESDRAVDSGLEAPMRSMRSAIRAWNLAYCHEAVLRCSMHSREAVLPESHVSLVVMYLQRVTPITEYHTTPHSIPYAHFLKSGDF